LRVERGLSAHTLRAYESDLEHFCDFMQNEKEAFSLEAEATRKHALLLALIFCKK
jgi:site-specific recombinase XerD